MEWKQFAKNAKQFLLASAGDLIIMDPDQKIKNYRSERYLRFIRGKRSLKSGRIGTEENPMIAAHQPFGRGGKALKGPDIWTVPLLWDEHQMEHCGHNAFWQGEDLKLRMLEFINEFLNLNKGKKI